MASGAVVTGAPEGGGAVVGGTVVALLAGALGGGEVVGTGDVGLVLVDELGEAVEGDGGLTGRLTGGWCCGPRWVDNDFGPLQPAPASTTPITRPDTMSERDLTRANPSASIAAD